MSQAILDRISVLVTAAAQNGLRQDGFAPTRYLQIVKAPVPFSITLGEPNGETIDVPAGTTGSIQICDPNTDLVDKFFLDVPAGSGEIVILSSPNMQVSFESGASSGGLSPRRLWTLNLGRSTPRGAGSGPLRAVQIPAVLDDVAAHIGVEKGATGDTFSSTIWDDALGFTAWLMEVANTGGDWKFIYMNLRAMSMGIGDIVSSAGNSSSVDISGNYFVMGTTVFARLTRVTAPGTTEISAFWGLGMYQRPLAGLEGGCVGFQWDPDDSPYWQAYILDYNGGVEVVRLSKPLTGVTAELTTQDLRLAWGYKAGGLPFVAWIVNGLVAHEISGHGLAVEPFPAFAFQPFCGVNREGAADKVELFYGMRGGWWTDHYSPNVAI